MCTSGVNNKNHLNNKIWIKLLVELNNDEMLIDRVDIILNQAN